ncbi:hypothetical protein [Peterkaempfera bronchialis]|uniref:hypothetical protein n=1 Tax=Peterkaempfera bronchialis TaxID=2126346 RepID=UPI0013B47309|nr:hypothetical protein [Peterkaempfera bronchialis]
MPPAHSAWLMLNPAVAATPCPTPGRFVILPYSCDRTPPYRRRMLASTTVARRRARAR